MKRFLVLLLAVAFFAGIFLTVDMKKGDAAVDFSIVRVKLSTGSATSITVTVDGNYSLAQNSSYAINKQSYTAKLEDGQVALYNGSTKIYSGTSFTLVQHQKTEGTNNVIKIYNSYYSGTYSYLGDMEFKVVSGQLYVINHVYIEEYLYGVLPYEMAESWPIEALKAQAVTARVYAVRSISSAANYDVVDTSSDQVYKGYNASCTRCIQAVDATSKELMTYGGSTIRAYFSASNGGYTEIPAYRWTDSTPMPYEVVKYDSYDIANPSSLCEKIYIPKIVDESNPFKGMLQMKTSLIMPQLISAGYVDSAGAQISISDDFKLKEMESITPIYTPGHDKYADLNAKCVHIDGAVIKAKVGTYRVEGTGIVSTDVEVTFTLDVDDHLRTWIGSDGKTLFNNTNIITTFIYEDKDSSNNIIGYTFYRGRYGHGIGLSQRGAQQRANSGIGYRDILNFYFPGVSIGKTVYINQPTLTPKPVTDPSDVVDSSTTKVVALGKVTVNTLNIRSSPSTASGSQILGKFTNGNLVPVTKIGYTSGWNQIIYNGAVAYVYQSYLTVLPAATKTLATAANIYTSTDGQTVAAAVSQGASVYTYTTVGSYTYVIYEGTGGYMPTSAFTADDSQPTVNIVATGTVNANAVNLRQTTSDSSTILAKVNKGASLQVVALYVSSTRHAVLYNGKTMYIYSTYITLSGGAKKTLSAAATIRKTASDSGTAVTSVAKGKSVTVYSTSGDYSYVVYGTSAGYIPTSAVTASLTTSTPTTPTSSTVTGYGNVINVNNAVNIRSAASASSTLLGNVTKGSTVLITAANVASGWHQILYNGQTAYVSSSYTAIYGTTYKGVVNATTLNLRKAGSGTSTILKVLKRNDTVVVLQKGASWTKVYYNGTTGYMSTQYLKIS